MFAEPVDDVLCAASPKAAIANENPSFFAVLIICSRLPKFRMKEAPETTSIVTEHLQHLTLCMKNAVEENPVSSARRWRTEGFLFSVWTAASPVSKLLEQMHGKTSS